MIYGDLFALLNALCDFFALRIALGLLGVQTKTCRLILSSALGGLYALAHLYIAHLALPDFFISLFVSLLMVFLALAPVGFRLYLRGCFCFYTVSFLLGGCVTALCRRLGRAFFSPPAALLLLILFFFLALFLSYAGGRLIRRALCRRTVRVTLTVGGRILTAKGLVDSGNLLQDRETGLPVIILSPGIFCDTPPVCARSLPMQTVSSSASLPCFLPDALFLDGREIRAVLALAPRETRFGNCAALVPASLCAAR